MTTVPPFQRALEAHGDAVWRYLRGMVGACAADDCFQETFIAALRAYPRLRPESNLRAWLLTIAHRKAIDHLRRQRRRRATARSGARSQRCRHDSARRSCCATAATCAIAKLPPRSAARRRLRVARYTRDSND